MEPQLSEIAAPLRVVWLAQSWRTFFSTTRSISGWRGHTRTSRGVGMRTTDWCTAETSKKHRRSSLSYKLAWQNAIWRCIQRKPKSPTAKTKKRKGTYPNVKFDFLGYCFRPRLVRRFRDNTLFCGFNPAVSSSAMKAMRSTIRELKLHHQTQLSLQDIARQLNPLLRGWIEYYGRYAPSALYPLLR